MKIKRTDFALVAKCKCGNIIAATMLHGGIEIDAEFMDEVADILLSGGSAEVVNTNTSPVVMGGCSC